MKTVLAWFYIVTIIRQDNIGLTIESTKQPRKPIYNKFTVIYEHLKLIDFAIT